jgi:hypothetical protein
MKPETKRHLAIEWLTLLTSILVGTGAIFWDKVPYHLEKYWKSDTDSIWFQDVSSTELVNYGHLKVDLTSTPKAKEKPALKELTSAFLKAENLGNTEDAKALAGAIRQMYSPFPKLEGVSSVSKLSDTTLIALYSQQKYPSSSPPSVSEPALDALPLPASPTINEITFTPNTKLPPTRAANNGPGATTFEVEVNGEAYTVTDAPNANLAAEAVFRLLKSSSSTASLDRIGTAPLDYKSSYRGKVRALSYAFRESLPDAIFLGVLLGIGIYIVLWIPRLTLRAVRIVKAKPSAL